MSDARLTIRPLVDADHAAWLPLWHAYLGYHGMWPEDAPRETWPRLLHPGEPMHALGAFVDGRLEGFAHYVYHRHPWSDANSCFLSDVFTALDARRRGIAKALIEAVFHAAAEAGASHVYGTTLITNESSQQLYELVAERSPVVVYRHQL